MTIVHQVNIGNWQTTGQSPRVTQYSVDVYVCWTDNEGTVHEHQGTYLFPNELADIPQEALRALMEQIIIAKLRVTLGISTWQEIA